MTKLEFLDKIIFYGDPHKCSSEINRILREINPCAIFILGDIEQPFGRIENPKNIPLFSVSGNHDSGQKIEGITNVDWSIIEIFGIRFLGVGGTEREFVELAKMQNNIDVVLSHYPPMESYHSNKTGIEIFDAVNASLFVHGHYHTCITVYLNGVYAGVRNGMINDIGRIPSINVTESAMTLGLTRLKPTDIPNRIFVDAVIKTEFEQLTPEEMIKKYKQIQSNNILAHQFVTSCLATANKRVIDNLIRNKPNTIPEVTGFSYALKPRHRKDWILIDTNLQITNISVSTSALNGVKNQIETGNSIRYWNHLSSKKRFNTTFLIKLNNETSSKFSKKFLNTAI